ncbi:SusC/RagA family TonB-linked outer membrane protein [Aquimarina hainanensis]|uniref:SusC/RagA family TonB-linked outer membrane protein n=1 Tax=Aquimarina hainanensis TaxID=1578017 RepID=A0ABW5N290_9FLAO
MFSGSFRNFRYIFFIFLFFCGRVTATTTSYDHEKISLDLTDVSLLQVFKEIEGKSSYKFFFKDEDIDLGKRFSIKVKDKKIDIVLSRILKNTSLTFHIHKHHVTIKPKGVAKKVTERIKVKGKVQDENSLPMLGVSILIKGTHRGISTGMDGEYEIVVKKGDILVFSYLGYVDKEKEVQSTSSLDVQMVRGDTTLDKVVLVGYDSMEKHNVTSPVASVKGDELGLPGISTFDRLLGGRIAGLSALQVSGKPGAGAIVNIRGVTSFRGANQPLYVIDGTPLVVEDNLPAYFNNGFGGVYRTHPLELIEALDVESVDVLKDAAAASIYGSRAANGVVLITTKRGKKNRKPKLTFNYRYSCNSPIRKNEMLDAAEYKEMLIGAARATQKHNMYNGLAALIVNPETNKVNEGYFGDADVAWQDEITRSSADVHEINTNLVGGSKKSTYYFSLGKTMQEGLFVGEDYLKNNLRANYDFDLTDKIKLGGGFNYQTSISNYSLLSSLDQVFSTRPDIPVRNKDGSLNEDARYSNLLAFGNSTKNKDEAINFIGNGYAKFTFLKDVTFRTAMQYAITDSKGYKYYKVRPYSQRTDYETKTYNATWDNTLQYAKTFSRHYTSLLIGTAFDYRRLDLTGAIYVGLPTDVFSDVISLAGGVFNAYDHLTESRLHSYFSRLNYNYDRRYYVMLSNRLDGYSKFGPNKRWAYFPSIGVSWQTSNEAFMNNMDVIDDLRFRFSIGRTGKANLPDFLHRRFYGSPLEDSPTIIGGETGIGLANVADKAIGWEKTEEYNVGMNVSLFDKRFSLSTDYFSRLTSGMIMYLPNLPSSGFNRRLKSSNSSMENKGLEVTLEAQLLRNKDVQWISALNVTFLKNTIKSVEGNLGPSLSPLLEEGVSLGSIYGLVAEGIFKNEDEIKEHAIQEGARVGDLKFVDLNGDGVINYREDAKVLGDIQPDIYGGWNNRFIFRNFEVGVDLQFSFGLEKRWAPLERITTYVNYGNNITKEMYENSWKPGKGDTKYPELRFDRYGGLYSYPSTANVGDASFVRLKNISFQYHIPRRLLKKLKISSASIYTNSTNLLTWTKYPGVDPEVVSTSGFNLNSRDSRDYLGYHLPKTMSWGIRLSF